MDILSVLLHEYAHTLGMDHNANPHDFMAPTLPPGVRRLPTQDELAQTARPAAEINGDAADPAAAATPDDPASPSWPWLPGAPLAFAFAGRLRSTRYGDLAVASDGPTSAMQYDTAFNPTFSDAAVQTGAGWSAKGSVTITNGTAVLAESPNTQTRLNQIFTLGANDRHLSFTLSGINLDRTRVGPGDAFEVAPLGLTHTDALLNLQADGSEYVQIGAPLELF